MLTENSSRQPRAASNPPMMMTAILLVLLSTVALSIAAPASRGEFGIRLDVGVPSGEFGDNVEDPGFGISGNASYLPSRAVAVGIGGNFLIYGRESRTETLPLVDDFEIVTNNNIASLFLLVQIRGQAERLIPYLEGRAGFMYLWTESKLEDDDWLDDEDIAEEVNYDDFAFTYGGGGGLMFLVHENQNTSIFIDLKTLYLLGGKANYLKEGGITIGANDQPIFDPDESKTDLLHIELGVAIHF